MQCGLSAAKQNWP